MYESFTSLLQNVSILWKDLTQKNDLSMNQTSLTVSSELEYAKIAIYFSTIMWHWRLE